MFLPIIFIAAFMLALTGALLESSVLAAKTAQIAAVTRISDVTISAGVADFTHGLAAYVARHGTGGPWPRATSRSATTSACATTAPACAFRSITSATITATSTAGEGAGTTPATGDAALNVQAAGIDEQRVSASVTTTIVGPSGSALGSRTRFLTYRVFTVAPYAVIAGSRDSATVNGRQSAAQGDSGGAAAQSDDGGAAATDTRIHVRLTCSPVAKNGDGALLAGNDGLPWGNAAQAAIETPCESPDMAADVFRDERWSNGDTNASGWTP